MSFDWSAAVIEHRTPLEPIETDVAPKLETLAGMRAVIFDLYGTLLISGSGDVGSAAPAGEAAAREAATGEAEESGGLIEQAMLAAGISLGSARPPTVVDLQQRIRDLNAARQSKACPKPEVDIVEVWRQTLAECGIEPVSTEQCNRLAAEYEARSNPTWPMPGARSLLATLRSRGLKLGIVSNAQAFTVPLAEDLDGRFGDDSVFDLNLCVFSYRYRQAKPSPRLFDVLCQGLHRAGIAPAQTVYVGNDRLNDIWAASQAGLRTAWFAGDRRSLRPRSDHAAVAELPHDVVLTRLDQLPECL